jgi:hypothetical protein
MKGNEMAIHEKIDTNKKNETTVATIEIRTRD